MKTLVLLSLCLAVALGMPKPAPGVEQNPEEDQHPLLGDVLPAQGHVVVNDPQPQVKPGSEVKVKPEVEGEQGGEEKTEVKKEPELKEKSDAKDEPEVKVEQDPKEVKPEPEVKVEQEPKEVKAEPEVKVAQEPKEVKAEPEVKVAQEPKEVKAEPEVKVAQEPKEVKAEPEVKVEQEPKEVKAEPEVKVEQEPKEVKAEPEVKVEQEPKEVKAEPEVKKDPEANVEPEVEVDPEPEDDLDFKVESEVKVDTDVLEEPEPEVEPIFDEVQEQFQVQMNLEPEAETGQEIEERHIDMEENYGMMEEPIMELEPLDYDMFGDELSDTEKSLRAPFLNQDPAMEPLPEEEGLMRQRDYAVDGEPIMELEPLDDDNMFGDELSDTEKSLRAPFLNQDPAVQPLSEGEGLMRQRDYAVDGEPIMELEPLDDVNMFEDKVSDSELSDVEKSMRMAFQNQDPVVRPLPEEGDYALAEEPIMELEPEMEQEQFVPDAAIMEDGTPLDNMEQQMQPLEEYFPNEAAQMAMEPMMMEEPVNEFVNEEELPPFEEPVMKDNAVLDGGVHNGGIPK